MALSPTDLPCPVAPATSKCGNFARSTMNISFVIVFPTAIGKSIVVSWKRFEFNTLSMDTMFCFLLGTSIPIVPFPGIGAMIRMPKAAKLKAMSSSRFLILEILTPSSGVISYNVIVGPTVAIIVFICTPKLLRTSTILFLFAFCSFMSI